MIRILKEAETARSEIFAREDPVENVEGPVREIIAQVRVQGDAALKAYTKEFDGVEISSVEVGPGAIDEGFRNADPLLVEILYRAAERVAAFHQHQVRNSFLVNDEDGILMGQKVVPLERVGLYVPGGTAAYPSSVLMNCIPAKLAGVKEICMVTPPGKDGKIPPNILAAARICGVDRVFRVGGAQAVAALAYGTESIPRVDKIVGPGNQYVAEAKKQVFGQVGIDMVAGPSEILVIADDKNNPQIVAADLLSQAEHDKNASAVLVTDSEELALAVQAAIEEQLPQLRRQEIARASIDNNGKIIVAKSLETGIEITNEIAPEHLEVCVENPFDYLDQIKNAGSVFLGRNCPEALGDYFAGPNHTLPTSGTARFSSPLSVDDFVKKYQYTYYTEAALAKAQQTVSNFAKKEGLTGHARSVDIRFDPKIKESK
ncbi:MAG: histidinol dehydrogenase [Evtepia sp.]|uniref:histidinol dehydrogenase n=1 Tax=Evtepia sp. TaxID=2773933 RepID=UPI002A7641EA|nr:histidinol dehydrogenase [Evtepia sp.]MDY3015299.1 histidinol dehydrogenase [Evtepia sp.]